MITLRPQSRIPLVNQIVDGLRVLVENRTLAHGTKLPSIRTFAATHAVSTFTVVEAYNRLVAQGLLTSRGNTGFFVNYPRPNHRAEPEETASSSEPEFDTNWYNKQIFENRHLAIKPGCGWLPHEWMFSDGLRRGMRQVAGSLPELSGYGDPMGYLDLRTATAKYLQRNQGIAAHASQVLVTHGSSQALDLAMRTLVKPGDVVLVDDPGYPNLLRILRLHGATLIGVPRTPNGYDMAFLESVLSRCQPSTFFTQPRLQSPTGSRASLPQLYGLLQLAERHDFRIVENDIYAELDLESQPSLASLDQLRRVAYIGSYSKTISPNLRVGYVLANPDVTRQFLELKMCAGLTSSEVMERVVHAAITDGHWRKHLNLLRQRLARAHETVARNLVQLGFELFTQPAEGVYIWARHPRIPNSTDIVRLAMNEGIMLGPGQLFLVEPEVTGWMRFNVAFSLDPKLWGHLESLIQA